VVHVSQECLIRGEVSEIAGNCRSIMEQGVQVKGWMEMPCELRWEIGKTAVRIADGAYVNGTVQHEQCMMTVANIMAVGFLMGREFGKLEAAIGLSAIAEAVPMSPCPNPTKEYAFTEEWVGD